MKAKFSRQHYIALADAIRSARKDAESAPGVIPESWNVPMNFVTERIARVLAADNARFNKGHFLAVVRGEKSITSRPSRKPVCGYCGQVEGTPEHRASNCAAKQRGEALVCPWCKEPIKDEDGSLFFPGSENCGEDNVFVPACPVCGNERCLDCADSSGHCPACSIIERCDECGEELDEEEAIVHVCAHVDTQGDAAIDAEIAADEAECDCSERSWYGPEHDSACPLAGQKREVL